MLFAVYLVAALLLAALPAVQSEFVVIGSRLPYEYYKRACRIAGYKYAVISSKNLDEAHRVMRIRGVEYAWVGGYVLDTGELVRQRYVGVSNVDARVVRLDSVAASDARRHLTAYPLCVTMSRSIDV